MLQKQDKTAGFPGAASNGAAKPASQLPAGPFDVSSAHRESETMTLPDALVTGVLVIYPVLATVAVIAVGLFLSAPIA